MLVYILLHIDVYLCRLTYQLFYQGNQLTSEADVEAWLTARNLSRQHLDYLITRNSKLEQFKQNTWGNKLVQAGVNKPSVK